MLREEPPPEDHSPTNKSGLVYAFAKVTSRAALADLVELSEAGNLRATQALASLASEHALPPLLKCAQAKRGNAYLIALEGLAKHFPKQSLDVLQEAITSSDKRVAKIAVEGLGGSGDAGMVPSLLPLLSDEELAFYAARALRRLPLGPHAGVVLNTLLTAENPRQLAPLTGALIRAGWQDNSDWGRIVDCIKTKDDYIAARLVTLAKAYTSPDLFVGE
jgi:hypothetical protein